MYTGIISLTQGNSFSFNSVAADCSGNPISLVGLTGAGYIKLKYGDRGVLDQFNFNITNAVSGNYNLSLAPIQTSNYPVNQGVYGVYVYSNALNSGTYQDQIAGGYINVYPELIPDFTGLYFQTIINSGNSTPNPETYFGASTLTISGSITYNDGLSGNQGYKTTRVNVLAPESSYISYFILNPTGAFIGATLNYIITMPDSLSPTLYFENSNEIILQQPPISGGGNVFIQFGFDGSNWQVNQWA